MKATGAFKTLKIFSAIGNASWAFDLKVRVGRSFAAAPPEGQ